MEKKPHHILADGHMFKCFITPGLRSATLGVSNNDMSVMVEMPMREWFHFMAEIQDLWIPEIRE